MLGNFRRTVQVKLLESRKKKLEVRRDAIIAVLCSEGTNLYRHEYPNTPVLEDICLELDYVCEALAGAHGRVGAQPLHLAA